MDHDKENITPDPKMKHWYMVYPLYLDATKTKEQGLCAYSLSSSFSSSLLGRLVPLTEAVDNPKVVEIANICKKFGFEYFIEV